MDQTNIAALEVQADRAFFARLGLVFAVSILVCGVMMVAVGPVSHEAERPQLAVLER